MTSGMVDLLKSLAGVQVDDEFRPSDSTANMHALLSMY